MSVSPVDRVATVGEPVVEVEGTDVRTVPLRFEKQGDRVRWESRGEGWRVERELAVGYRENTAAMRVTVRREGKAGAIGVRIGMPVLLRDFHKLDEEIGAGDFEIDVRGDGFAAWRTLGEARHRVEVRATGARFVERGRVEAGIAVPHELDRGDETLEARFWPGDFEAELAAGVLRRRAARRQDTGVG